MAASGSLAQAAMAAYVLFRLTVTVLGGVVVLLQADVLVHSADGTPGGLCV